jgi:S-adenosylmethionine:tRNA ribosyltransferase-isomerase
MNTADLDYNLPRELIPYGPTPFRGDARLMVLHRGNGGKIEHRRMCDLPALLKGYEVWVNNSAMLRAKLNLWRDTGHVAETWLTEQTDDPCWWIAEIRTHHSLLDDRRSWRTEDGIKVELVSYTGVPQRWKIRFDRVPDLAKIGKLPLPGHVRQPACAVEEAWYQPVYASSPGGYFAPTAGIHLTKEMVDAIQPHELTLHIDLDSIRTIETETVEEHARGKLKPESYWISSRSSWTSKPICAVGTTVVKALETMIRTDEYYGKSDLFVGPGFEFKIVNGLLTNFHLPRESLLALSCAFAGNAEWVMDAYHEAVKERYRIGDYGDLMLIL